MTELTPEDLGRLRDQAGNDQELARLREEAPGLPASVKVFAHVLLAQIVELDGIRTVTTIGASLVLDRAAALVGAETTVRERYPEAEGYFDHAVSVFEIPHQMMRAALGLPQD